MAAVSSSTLTEAVKNAVNVSLAQGNTFGIRIRSQTVIDVKDVIYNHLIIS